MARSPDLSELAARQAITNVIHLYAHAIDRRRWALMDRCFHQEATYRFAMIEGDWRKFVALAQATIDPLRLTHHQIGNIICRLDDDGATTETYFTAHHRVAATAATTDPFPGKGIDYDVVLAGRYIDTFVCRDGDWKIAHRIGLTDWRHDGPASDADLYSLPAAWRGGLDDSDPGRSAIVD